MLDGRRVGDDALYSKVAWRLVPFLMVCYAIAYLDRVNIGFAKLGMSADLGLSEAAYGLGAGIFFVGYFLFEVPSNMLLHRLGARAWITRIMISWSLLSALCAFIQGSTSFYVLRFFLGIAEAGFFPGIILYLTYWFPAARRGQVIATFMIAIPLAGLIGGPLSGFIMAYCDGLAGWAGWRWMFVIEALPALLLGIALPFVLDSRVQDARWLDETEKALIQSDIARDHVEEAAHRPIGALFADPVILKFAAIYFCCIMGQYGITFWLPTMIGDIAGGSVLMIGLIAILPYACAILAMICVSRHSDRTGERRWHLILPLCIAAITIGVAPLLADQVWLSIAILCVASAATLTATPLFWNLPTARLSGKSAAVGIAAINSIGNLAGFISPALVGWVNGATGIISTGMIMLGVVLFAGGLMTWSLKIGTRDASSAGMDERS